MDAADVNALGSSPRPAAWVPKRGAVVQLGDTGTAVRLLHAALALVDPDSVQLGGDRYTEATVDAVRRLQESMRLEPTGELDSATGRYLLAAALRTPHRAVIGQVLAADGRPAPDVSVMVTDRNVGGDAALNTGRVDPGTGIYTVRYAMRDLGRPEKPAADLVVTAVGRDGQPLVSSPVRHGAGPVEVIDIEVTGAAATSEYDDVVARTVNVLAGQHAAELLGDDVVYVAGAAGVPVDRLGHLVTGERVARRIEVSAAVAYAWDRAGLVAADGDLVDIPVGGLLRVLDEAVAAGVVSADAVEDRAAIMQAVVARRADRMLDPKDADKGALGRLLPLLVGEAAVPDQQRRRLAEALAEASPDTNPAKVTGRAGLSDPQVQGLRGLATLSRAVGDDDALIAAAYERVSSLAADSGQPPAVALATLRPDEWREVVRAAHPDLGDGLDEAARAVHRRVALLLSNEALLGAAAREPSAGRWAMQLRLLEPLLADNQPQLDVPFDQLDTSRLTDAQREAARAAYAEVGRVARAFPGLRVAALWAEGREVKAAGAELERRLRLLSAVLARNAGTDFLTLDYLPGSADVAALRLDGLDEHDRAMVLDTVKAFQRVHRVSPDPVVTRHVLENGFTAAGDITDRTLPEFQTAARLAEAEARQVYARAMEASVDANLQLFAVLDHALWVGDRSTALGSAAPTPEVGGYLRRLPGFDELLGVLGGCRCAHCSSVLSPAAYFVDLMSLIDRHITTQVFTGPRTNHRLKLANRRPDLWRLPLTCANTSTLVPTLDLVNEVLEDYIARDITPTPQGRDAIHAAVYARLAEAQDSFAQPFVLPLRRIEAYLRHFRRTRADVAEALGANDEAHARARLGVGHTEWDLLATPGDQAQLTRLYGAEMLAGLTPATRIDLRALLRLGRRNRDTLVTVLRTGFVRGPNTIKVQGAKSAPGNVQNDIEVVTGLDAGVVDRLHRFTRLRDRLGWPVPDLDLVLAAVQPGGVPAPVLGAAQLVRLARLADLRATLAVSADVLCSLFADIPTAAPDGARPLFDRLFNLEPFVSRDGRWPSGQQFVHPSQGGGSSTPNNRALQRLLAGLGVDDQALVDLIAGLGLGPSFALDAANLTALHRHTRLAGLLDLDVPVLFQFLRIVTPSAPPRVAGYDDLLALVRQVEDWRRSGWTLDELGFITSGPVLDPAELPDVETVTAEVARAVRTDRPFELADTAFAQLAGVTETQSRSLVSANPDAFEPAGGQALRLRDTFDPVTSTLVIPGGVPTTAAQVRQLLDRYHPRQVLPSRLAAWLGLPEATVRGCSALLDDLLDRHDAALVRELRGDGAPTKLRETVAALAPLGVLFRAPAWDGDALAFVAANPAIFGLTLPADENPVGFTTALRVADYVRRCAPGDPAFGAADRPDPGAVRTVLHDGFADATVAARALRRTEAQVAAVKPHVPLDAVQPFAGLDRLAATLDLADLFGVSGETLRLLVPTAADAAAEFAALAQAAEGMYAVIRTKYADEAQFLATLEPFEDEIRGRCRDGLADYVIRSLPSPFETPSDLYAYFLMDTAVEGCARTSRIVAATASLQLYVHRVLMNLEQDDAAGETHIHVLPTLVPASWEWTRNYRVWEANRKVFLFPENYVEPPLRDDKTPLFDDVEAELLQREISEASATTAYARYLAGFREVSQLQIAGSYHERDTAASRDILHLFGATASDPPVYYYRAIADMHAAATQPQTGRRTRASAWLPLKLQISSPRVSPVPFRGTLYLFWATVNSQERTLLSGGNSTPADSRHKIDIRYTSRHLDGGWSTPQAIRNPQYDNTTFLLDTEVAQLTGFPFDRVYPGRLVAADGTSLLYIAGMGSGGDSFEPYTNTVVGKAFNPRSTQGLQSTETINGLWHNSFALSRATGQVFGFGQRTAGVAAYYQASQLLHASTATATSELIRFRRAPAVELVNGAVTNCIVDAAGDVLLLQELSPGGSVLLHRLGTTAAETIALQLHRAGLGPMLALDFQETLVEAVAPVESSHPSVADRTSDPKLSYRRRDGTTLARPIDFSGPYGMYFREIFFHIPFLIADHLNGAQRFSAAQRWYHTVFDPTSSDVDADRAWRYREFRGRTPESLRKTLTDPEALAAYRDDPFNPHAIARLRLGAYQKAVVMKYIDNLLDWGDALFAEFTMESVNEATMLYVMAADILGPKSPDLGPCGHGAGDVTYADIAARAVISSDFLIELEHLPSTAATASTPNWLEPLRDRRARTTAARSAGLGTATDRRADAADPADGAVVPVGQGGEAGFVGLGGFPPGESPAGGPTGGFGTGGTGGGAWRIVGGTGLAPVASYDAIDGPGTMEPAIELGPRWPSITVSGTPVNPGHRPGGTAPIDPPRPGSGGLPGNGGLVPFDYTLATKFLRMSAREQVLEGRGPVGIDAGFGTLELGKALANRDPVFCLPRNDELLGYWDRVEKRLFQIRNCMDITGARRQLPLFAPEIDPRLLVRARAAGLSLDEVLGTTAGNVPPYRFSFLIDKARSFAASVQAFGAALRAVLETRDAEQLNQLRTVHEQNTLKLRTRALQAEIDAARDSLAALTAQRGTAEYRRTHYNTLSDTGLTEWERAQQTARHLATVLKGAESIVHLQAAITYLIPQLGSPFAMKYGGQELGHSGVEFAQWTQAMASILDAAANSAGLEASFQRRDQDWRHQRRLAEDELRSFDRQISAAKLRVEIAEKSLESHQKAIEQTEEQYAFYREKFTGTGLYAWLSTRLHRLHREAFNSALAVAQMAEQAYRFERRDDEATVLGGGYFDAAQAGLLAGDRLLLDLQELERRFVETNYRRLEVEQHFSLRRFDPAALVRLQESGRCEFVVSEEFFDLAYPGHYRRLLKAVRVTIPCVVGPWTGVGAELRLLEGSARVGPDALLRPIPLRHSTVVATSSAERDAGVFEFTFRDERYMPFEGAGAVSRWRLTLPGTFRPFDYTSISDVVLTLDYEASESTDLRAKVESTQQDQQRALATVLRTTGLPVGYSLRHEFREAWRQWTADPPDEGGRTWAFAIDGVHLPYVLASARLAANRAQVLIRLAPAAAATHGADTVRLAVTAGDTSLANLTPTADGDLLVATADLTTSQRASGVPFTEGRLQCRVGIMRQRLVNGAPETIPIDPTAIEDAWVVLRLVPA
ncbi:neuraminidase-like domain-containing protein [Streptomyces chartreusis]|uniref:Tc toxin subunit A-related protein n=1 Tax=Streptomyces chartreusis TaxID=1969 RepID=UPI003D92533C